MTPTFTELMLRAPAVPEWFEPEMQESCPLPENVVVTRSGRNRVATFEDVEYVKAVRRWESEKNRQKAFQWPSYYARKVMEAAEQEAQKQPGQFQEQTTLPVHIEPFPNYSGGHPQAHS